MLTPEDIKNLTEYQKTVFVTKEEFNDVFVKLKQSINILQISVDGLAKDTAPKLEIEFKH